MAVSVQRAGKPPRQRCLQQAGAPRGAPKPQRWPPDGSRSVFSFVLVLATRCSGCVPAPSRSQALQAVLGVCPQGPGGGQEAAGDGAPGCSSSAFLPVASPRELASAGGVDTRPRRGQPGGARGPVCSAGRLLWEAAHSPGQPRESAEASVSARGAGPRRGSHCWVWAWALEGASAGLACCPWALGGASVVPWRSRTNEGGWFGTESHEDMAASFGHGAPPLQSDALGSLSCGQEFPPSSAGPEPLRRRAAPRRPPVYRSDGGGCPRGPLTSPARKAVSRAGAEA